jgi:hypothetical protein
VSDFQLALDPETAIAYFIALIVLFPDVDIQSRTVLVNDRVHKIKFGIDNELLIW